MILNILTLFQEAVKTLFTRYGATLYAFISRETQISY